MQKEDSSPSIIANRYKVEKIIGRGGMAVVYQVVDVAGKKKLALKRLEIKGSSKRRESATGLFEYEFHTLAQLAHPGIIEVYNYGIDESTVYYTMELLDGGDLKDLAPLPWKKTCALLSDICSALGLIHSRRQVHRDLTPRNVRCTRDAKAKLIDFGAMVPMGPSRQLVGTPPFTAPEVVTLQSLDARTDLYSLGGTFYFVLTGRNAFPARDFSELRDMWRTRPYPPSSFVKDIPKELDQLVLSLLSLEPIARPENISEVLDRLSAIAGIKVEDQQSVARAYLSTPTLVGRDRQLADVHDRMTRAFRTRGDTLVIEGASGIGRSRFLDACVLKGKLLGATVLKADAADARVGSWGVVRTIAAQLLDALPLIALQAVKPHVSVLGHVLPELIQKIEQGGIYSWRTSAKSEPIEPFEIERLNADSLAQVWGRGNSWRPPQPTIPSDLTLKMFDDPRELRPRVQEALLDWLIQVSEHHCIVVAIDDLQSVDEPSAAFSALLARRIANKKLILAVAIQTTASSSSDAALRMIKDVGHRIKLPRLDSSHTEKLLDSVFGKVPHVKHLASRLHVASRGNPRAIMRLTQHLVDKGLVAYRSGAWTIPSSIDVKDFPSSIKEALKTRVRRLSNEAMVLAQTVALNPEQSFSYEECLVLSVHHDPGKLIRNLSELVACDVFHTDGEYYAFSQRGWVAPLIEMLDKQTKRSAHTRLAEVFQKSETAGFRVAQHLSFAQEEDRALDAWVRFATCSKEQTDKNPEAFTDLVQSLPKDWFESYEAAIDLAQKRKRPKKEIYALQTRLIGIMAAMGVVNTSYLNELIQQLTLYSGLATYWELQDTVEAKDRLGRALELTQQRYDSSPESERVLAPIDAIRELARALISALAILSSSYDYAFWRSLPSLEPYLALSPALGVVDQLIRALGNRITARDEEARKQYQEIVERLDQPDHAGLEDTYYRFMRYGVMRGLGMVEAAMGLESSLDWAAEIEVDPTHEVNAWRIRMTYYIWQGASEEVERCKERVELLQVQNSPTQWFEGSHLSRWAVAYALADDMRGVKQVIDGIEKMARSFPSWIATYHYVRGEYQRIRGDYRSALDELEVAYGLTEPGQHQNWTDITGAYLRTLLALGQDEEVRTEGRRLLQIAAKENLSFMGNYIKMPLAIAEAKLGEHQTALERAESVINDYIQLGVKGINLGLACETGARVAMLMNDRDSFLAYAKRCAEQYNAGHNAALTAKYEKLAREVDRERLGVDVDTIRSTQVPNLHSTSASTTVSTMLEECKKPEDRTKLALELLIRHCNCTGGYLYTLTKNGPVLSAQNCDRPPPPDIETIVRERFAEEIGSTEGVTVTGTEIDASTNVTNLWTGLIGDRYQPVLIGHHTENGYAITGMAVLLLDPSRKMRFPADVVITISRAFFDAGDVCSAYAAE